MQAIDSPDGLFHDGNPAAGAMGTVVSSDWLNAVQGELKHMVEGLGGTLDPARNDQISALLLEALGKRPTGDALTTELAKKLGNTEKAADSAALDGHPADYFARATDLAKAAGIPLLHPIWCPSRAAIPAGYAPADGQTLARSLYPDAWAGIAASNVPTVADATWLATPTERGKFTAGDGATTFRLPDYNGRSAGSLGAVFQRGWSSAPTVRSGFGWVESRIGCLLSGRSLGPAPPPASQEDRHRRGAAAWLCWRAKVTAG